MVQGANKSQLDIVAVIGNATMDEYLLGLPCWPKKPGARYAFEKKEYRLGGNATTVAISLSAMRNVKINVFTGMGHGGHGDAIRNAFQGKPWNGVPPLIGSISSENANPKGSGFTTGTTTIRLDAGEPEFITCAGANATITCAFLQRHLATIATSGHLHIGGIGNVLSGIDFFELETFLQDVRKRNPDIIISLDVVLPSEQASFGQNLNLLLFRVLPQVDFFVPNIEEAYLFAGINPRDSAQGDEGLIAEAARKLNVGKVREAIIIKRGCDGVSVFTRSGDTFEVPPDTRIPRDQITDSVGAGDTWDAGFIASKGMGFKLRECCRIANRVAASCITALGATAGIQPIAKYQHGIS